MLFAAVAAAPHRGTCVVAKWQNPAELWRAFCKLPEPASKPKRNRSRPSRRPSAGLQASHHSTTGPSRVCMPEVQLPLLAFSTYISPINNHHVGAITDLRKIASLHFAFQCQRLPTPFGTPEQDLMALDLCKQYLSLKDRRKAPCPSLQSWADLGFSLTQTRPEGKKKRKGIKKNKSDPCGFDGKIPIWKTTHCTIPWAFH